MSFFEMIGFLWNLAPIFLGYFVFIFIIVIGFLFFYENSDKFYFERWKVLIALFSIALIISIIPYGVMSLFSSGNEFTFDRTIPSALDKFYASFWGVILGYMVALVGDCYDWLKKLK